MRKLLAIAALLVSTAALASGSAVFADANQTVVHSAATITSNGSTIIGGFAGRQVDLAINIKSAPTGTSPTLQFTVQDVDPGDVSTAVGSIAKSPLLNATGTWVVSLASSNSGSVKVSWTIGGTTPSFTNVNTTLRAKGALGVELAVASTTIGTTNGSPQALIVALGAGQGCGWSVSSQSSPTFTSLGAMASKDGGATWFNACTVQDNYNNASATASTIGSCNSAMSAVSTGGQYSIFVPAGTTHCALNAVLSGGSFTASLRATNVPWNGAAVGFSGTTAFAPTRVPLPMYSVGLYTNGTAGAANTPGLLNLDAATGSAGTYSTPFTASSLQSLSSAVLTANTATVVKGSANGGVYGLACINANATPCYLQFYNSATAPTCGTGVVSSVPLPSSGYAMLPPSTYSLFFGASGVGVCMGTTPTGATACTTANNCTLWYK